MRCASICSARQYPLSVLRIFFKNLGFQSQLFSQVLRISNVTEDKMVFFFPHGSFVTWGFTNKEETEFIQLIKPMAIEPLSKVEARYFICRLGSTTKLEPPKRFNTEIITLESDNPAIKLAISYGLSESIKLESYEQAIQVTIKKNSYIIEELVTQGSISLSSKAISKRMGEIFLARSSVNLNSDFLNVPDYFWEHPNLENYYEMTEQFLDISSRVTALNQQLDVLHELFNMLTGHLQHKHSSLLEGVVILLIFIEIVLTSIQMIFLK